MKKIIILSLSVILTAAIAYVIIARWNIWFGNPAEPPYRSHPEPYNILLTFSPEGNDFRSVTWQCDTLAGTATLLYTLQESGDTLSVAAAPHIYRSQGGASAFYHASLHTPQPGIYNHRISQKADSSQWMRFTIHDTARDNTAQFI